MSHSKTVRGVPALAGIVLLSITIGCASTGQRAMPDSAPVAGNSFVVEAVRAFDGERVHEKVNVVVRDGRIESVGTRRPPRDLPVIDGTGRTLLPGLIDAHGHVSNETAVRDALRFGVTTVLDMLTSTEVARANKARRGQAERTDVADFYS